MKRNEFNKLKTYDWEDNINSMELGEYFLMGENMVKQQLNEIKYVSYYEITSKQNNKVTYIIKMEKLEDK